MEDNVLQEFPAKIFQGKTVLVTGGTGSFGKALVRYLLNNDCPKKIIVFSRDEMKQYMMKEEFGSNNSLEFVLGDVRDKEKLERIFRGVDYIIHAAAIKIVPSAEENPAEAVKTNVIGAMNVIDSAIKNNVKKVIAFSTDKACNPVNLYGATKLCSDKLFIAANSSSETAFSIVRYGNVIGSRGSIIPIFMEKKKEGVIPITDERMTRFWITLEEGVRFVLKNLNRMRGGEIFVPKIPSMRIVDLARAIAPECAIKYIGVRPGEKLHEIMISSDDARNTTEFDDYYIIRPQCSWWVCEDYPNGMSVPEGFSYCSNTNPHFLTVDQMRELIKNQLVS
jgi:UDP-N-acetylglucosamine 4,6-dehydratase